MTDQPKHIMANLSADALHRLAPLLMSREEAADRGLKHDFGAFWIEPITDGGVLIIATNGHAMGIIRDAEGGASEPCSIFPSEGLLSALAPPPRHRFYVEDGGWDEVELPDEYLPGRLFASSVGISVHHRGDQTEHEHMLHTELAEFGSVWSGGTRITASRHQNWHKPSADWSCGAEAPSHQRINPNVFTKFGRIDPRDPLDMAFPSDDEKPVFLTSINDPNFFGLLMRGRRTSSPRPMPSLPEWVALAAPKEGATA